MDLRLLSASVRHAARLHDIDPGIAHTGGSLREGPLGLSFEGAACLHTSPKDWPFAQRHDEQFLSNSPGLIYLVAMNN